MPKTTIADENSRRITYDGGPNYFEIRIKGRRKAFESIFVIVFTCVLIFAGFSAFPRLMAGTGFERIFLLISVIFWLYFVGSLVFEIAWIFAGTEIVTINDKEFTYLRKVKYLGYTKTLATGEISKISISPGDDGVFFFEKEWRKRRGRGEQSLEAGSILVEAGNEYLRFGINLPHNECHEIVTRICATHLLKNTP